MNSQLATGLLIMLVIKSISLAADPPAPGKQVGVTFPSPTDATIETNYLVFLPNDYGKPDQKWPLLIFLHGAGECGEDLNLVKIHGPPKLVEQKPADFPFIVVSPQAEMPMTEGLFVENWQVRPLSQWLDHLLETYAVDADRVYLTGLSMGGFGTLRWAAHEPQRFAAIVPICGGGWHYYGKYLKDVPTWMFHGDQDEAVPVRFSQEIAESIRKAGGDPKLTIYEGVGHDSWTATYDNPEVYKWLLSHNQSDRKSAETK